MNGAEIGFSFSFSGMDRFLRAVFRPPWFSNRKLFLSDVVEKIPRFFPLPPSKIANGVSLST